MHLKGAVIKVSRSSWEAVLHHSGLLSGEDGKINEKRPTVPEDMNTNSGLMNLKESVEAVVREICLNIYNSLNKH